VNTERCWFRLINKPTNSGFYQQEKEEGVVSNVASIFHVYHYCMYVSYLQWIFSSTLTKLFVTMCSWTFFQTIIIGGVVAVVCVLC
jgi:hypothetical protein